MADISDGSGSFCAKSVTASPGFELVLCESEIGVIMTGNGRLPPFRSGFLVCFECVHALHLNSANRKCGLMTLPLNL